MADFELGYKADFELGYKADFGLGADPKEFKYDPALVRIDGLYEVVMKNLNYVICSDIADLISQYFGTWVAENDWYETTGNPPAFLKRFHRMDEAILFTWNKLVESGFGTFDITNLLKFELYGRGLMTM